MQDALGGSKLILSSASAAAIIKITFLSNYGKHGDFLFDSSDLTIWFVSPVRGQKSIRLRQLLTC